MIDAAEMHENHFKGIKCKYFIFLIIDGTASRVVPKIADITKRLK